MNTRIEHDTMGEIAVPADHHWGAQTQRSLENFRIGGQRQPREIITAFACLKEACARANARCGKLTEAQAGAEERIFNWGAEAMHAREAGAVSVERAPVTVAVVDSGVEDTHPDLAGRVDTERSVKCSVNGVATQDFYGWRDEFYHGTHVAGIIAANHNDIGIDGIAPQATIVAHTH